MANRFDKYKPEEEKVVRKIEVVENRALGRLKKAWDACDYDYDVDRFYARALHAVKRMAYSAKDVENFSTALSAFQEEAGFSGKVGVFLSALINGGKGRDYVVHTSHLSMPVGYLGFRNTKNITVWGDIQHYTGYEMKSGSITINGNVKFYIGRDMKGGSITVSGNAEAFAGYDMRRGSITVKGDIGDFAGIAMQSGTITVEGNAGEYACSNMKGGEFTILGNASVGVGHQMVGGQIRLEGDYVSIADDVGHGKIFHKGVLIVDK
jgi:formylmethanofuran dehydrogenase subunit C